MSVIYICSRNGATTQVSMALNPPPLSPTQFSWFWMSWSGGTLRGGPGNRTGDWTETFIYAPDVNFTGVSYASVSAGVASSVAQWIIPCYYRPPGRFLVLAYRIPS